MKNLQQMNNLDRAYLLANLFPDELKGLTEFMKKEADLFTENRAQVYAQWTEKNIDADHWFSFIANFQNSYTRNGTRLHRNKKTFRDQLFDGYPALFILNALLHFTEQKECSSELKYALYMLFGTKKLIDINFNTSP